MKSGQNKKYKIGDWVWLCIPHYLVDLYSKRKGKSAWRVVGPVEVTEIREFSYVLAIKSSVGSNTFHPCWIFKSQEEAILQSLTPCKHVNPFDS